MMKVTGSVAFDVINVVMCTAIIALSVHDLLVGHDGPVSATSLGLLFVYTNAHIMLMRIEMRKKSGEEKQGEAPG